MPWLDDLTRYAHDQMSEEATEALLARGVSEEQIRFYGLGVLDGELPAASYPESFLTWCGHGQKLDHVFVLPLTNALGDVRGVQFRYMDRDRSGYMDFIEGKDEPVLFGLAQAMPHIWTTHSVYLVEGGFDLFPVQRVFPGVIATLTARVTEPFVRLLRRLVDRVWVGYDADDTGRKATERFAKRCSHYFDIRPIRYPQVPMVGSTKRTKDPGDLWETWGDARFQDYLRPLLKTATTELFDVQDLR
jgi:DNA primase